MITKTFVEEIKHIVTWFVNVYGQYDDIFLQWGGLDTLSSGNHILNTLLWKSWLRPWHWELTPCQNQVEVQGQIQQLHATCISW